MVVVCVRWMVVVGSCGGDGGGFLMVGGITSCGGDARFAGNTIGGVGGFAGNTIAGGGGGCFNLEADACTISNSSSCCLAHFT